MGLTLQIILSIEIIAMSGFIGWLFHKLKKHDDEREVAKRKRLDKIMAREQAINEALRTLCRDRIFQRYRYYKRQGGISPADLETRSKLSEFLIGVLKEKNLINLTQTY